MTADKKLEQLYNRLPRAYRYYDYKYNAEQLKRFLQALVEGGIYPVYKETRDILNLIDYDRIPAEYLPYLAGILGFTFPYDLDEQTQRTYIKNAVRFYRAKGTRDMLLFMIRELTGFRTTVELDKENKEINVLLEIEDTELRDTQRFLERIKFIVEEYTVPVRAINVTALMVLTEFFDIKQITYDETQPIITIENREKYDINKILLQDKYAIMNLEDGQEVSDLNIQEELTDLVQLRQTSTEHYPTEKSTYAEGIITISGEYDTEFPLSKLNYSWNLHTAKFSEIYNIGEIDEEYEETIEYA